MSNIGLGKTELIIKILTFIGWFLAGFFSCRLLEVIKGVCQ